MSTALTERTHAPLPHLTVSWRPGQPAVRVEPFEGILFASEPGLSIRSSRYRPELFCVEDRQHFVGVVGHPILGERIDRPRAVQGYVDAKDKARFVATLNGEFLIIHLDKTSQMLTIVNDRFAAIPFYYAQLNGRMIGSVYYNDLWKELREGPQFKLNEEAFFEFLYLQRLLGTKTYDTSSRFLHAATILTLDGDRLLLTRYWEPSFEKASKRSVEDFAREFIWRLKQSIRRKTSDGRRYGLFLSGGMDTRTIVAAFDPPPVCFTAGFSETNEVRIARRVTHIRGAPHHFILLPPDYYARYTDALIRLGGGMYVYDHALFYNFHERVAPHADVVFHGHGMDYLFQGMYLPTTPYRLFSHQSYLRRLRAIQDDVVSDYLSNIKYRLKYVDLFRYVRPASRERLRESLRHAVQEIVDEGRRVCHTPFDYWEYLLIHALSRHYSNCNISDLITSAEQRTVTFENELFNFYLSLPETMRFAATMMRRALRLMNPQLAELESANTGLKIDSSLLEQELAHCLRYLKRVVTGNPKYRHPNAQDRTWPYRDVYLRAHPALIQHIREASRSEVLAASLPFLDMDTLSSDINQWLTQPRGGGDLMATILTIDRFLKQP